MTEGRSWPGESVRASDLFILTTSSGLFAGLVEGAGLCWFQKTVLAGGTVGMLLVSPRILYVSALTDVVLFLVTGFLVAWSCRLVHKIKAETAVLFVLFFMLVFDCLCIALDRVMDPPYTAILSAGIASALLRGLGRWRKRVVWLARKSLPILATILILVICAVNWERFESARVAAAGLPAATKDAPNVLIIVMDTVRADHLSALGYPRATTPNLDQIASEGVIFENAFSTSSWTLPAHASLLTGRFPFEHGAEVVDYDGRYPTLPEAFEARGYRTAAFSANTYFFARENGFGRGFLYFDGASEGLADSLIRTMYGRLILMLYEQTSHFDVPGRKSADQINSHFLEWLGQERSRPFFAVLNYFDAHAPYLPPAPFRGKFARRSDPGGILNPWADRDTLDQPGEVQDERDAYDGGIAYIDSKIGALMRELRARGLADNTLVAVLADHGEFFGEHGLYTHCNALNLEGIRVPLLMEWPGHVPAGRRISEPVSTAWLAATVMTLAPGRGDGQFPGPSLTRFWSGDPAPGEGGLILSELVPRRAGPEGGPHEPMESLLDARWHFILAGGVHPRLFDWKKDPEEQHDLAQTADGQRVVVSMMMCLPDRGTRTRRVECSLNPNEPNDVAENPSTGGTGQ